MAQFLRGKQAGVQHDLSAGLAPELFALDQVARYGINSQISTLAYDPVQSLLAVGTNESRYGSGQIYVFGGNRVSVVLSSPRKASIATLQFCAEKLLSLDSKNDIAIFSLEAKKLVASYSPPSKVTALLTDPTLDYALIGLQNGDIIAYDLDRQALAPFRIMNLWKEHDRRSRNLPVIALALHPRDIGTLLIGYPQGAVIYSFKQNKPLNYIQYELQPGAPGGIPDPISARRSRTPQLLHAAWHPTGTFILTGHDDSSLVIWDSKTGKLVLARTLQDVNIDRPGKVLSSGSAQSEVTSLNAPLFRIAWCCKQNPDDTGILISGGSPTGTAKKGLNFLDFGQTPVYATSSWQVLSDHFAKPKSQYRLITPPNTEAVDFCIIPRNSPHYAGASDPIAVIALLASGELLTMSFPSGHPITPTNQLHASLTFVHPFVNLISTSYVQRTRWLGMIEKRSQGPRILVGGAEATRPMKRYEDRNILLTAHADSTVRVWDAGHGDEIENGAMLQVDVARAVGRTDAVDISHMSMSGATGELAAGLTTGEVAIFRHGYNHTFGQEISHVNKTEFGLEDIKDRADPTVKEGLLPLTLFPHPRGSVTAIRISDVGFVVAGFENGSITVIDLRGPAVIHEANLHDFAKVVSRGSIRRSTSNHNQTRPEWVVVVEFAVMGLEGEEYSSILFFLGTNLGRFITFKLLPMPNGGYSAQLAGTINLDDKVVSISPISADTGSPASASPDTVASLRNGFRLNGVVIVATQAGVRIFKPAGAKGASKTWNDFLCDSARVVRYEDRGYALAGLFGDGTVKTYSIPSLKEIASTRLSDTLDPRRFSEAIITPTGDIFGWIGPSELGVVNPWGSGQDTTLSLDKLYNKEALLPPRPTISNIQWISGTQYVTPSDLDVLIGGSDRPPSKRMVEQMRSEEQQRRAAGRSADTAGPSSSSQDEGYWAYMQRQVQERTEKLNIMGDSMDRLEEHSSNWADDVGKFVSQQKRKAVMGSTYILRELG
ncbi:hypothetical protein MMC32_000868 [Xylographa parallela]|nr:hypothetical protein [Xylographa parallela]